MRYINRRFTSLLSQQRCKLMPGTWSHSICSCILWPCNLVLWPFKHKTVTSRISQGHSLCQVRTLWDHLFVSYAANTQTHTHTQTLLNALLPRLSSAWVIILLTIMAMSFRTKSFARVHPLNLINVEPHEEAANPRLTWAVRVHLVSIPTKSHLWQQVPGSSQNRSNAPE